MANFFDQFDAPKQKGNFFDQFDKVVEPAQPAAGVDGVAVGDDPMLRDRQVSRYNITAGDQYDAGKARSWSDIAPEEMEAKAKAAGIDPRLLKTRAHAQIRRKLYPEIAKAEDEVAQGITHSALQGLTFGLADEGIAGIASAGGADYDKSLGFVRDKQDKFREENPGLAFGAELAGGAALPLGTIGSIGKGASFLDKAKNLGKVAGVGAGYGAAYGFGAGEGGFSERLGSAGTGAAIGAVVPHAVQGAAKIGKGLIAIPKKAAEGVATAVKNKFGDADELATAKILQALERSQANGAPVVKRGPHANTMAEDPGGAVRNYTDFIDDAGRVGDPSARLAEIDDRLAALAGPNAPAMAADEFAKLRNEAARLRPMLAHEPIETPAMLADISKPMQQLLGTANRVPGRGSSVINAALDARMAGTAAPFDKAARRMTADEMANPNVEIAPQWKRLHKAAGRALGLSDDMGGFATYDALKAARSARADRIYSAAYKSEKPFSVLSALKQLGGDIRDLDEDTYKSILGIARKVVQDVDGAGKKTRLLGDRSGDLRKVHHRKKNVLDAAIAGAKQSGNGDTARILTRFKERLLTDMESSNPIYREGRKAFRGDSEALDAFDWGRKALNDDVELNLGAWRKFGDDEKEMASYGILKALEKLMTKKDDTHDMARVLKKPAVQELLNEAMTDAPRFNRIFELESRMMPTKQIATGNSATAERLAHDAENNIEMGMATAGNVARRNFATAAVTWVRDLVAKWLDLREDVALQVARKLTTLDRVELRKLANDLDRMTRSRKGTQLVKEFRLQRARLDRKMAQGIGQYGGTDAAQEQKRLSR